MDCLELWILVIISPKLHNVRQFLIPDNPISNFQLPILSEIVDLSTNND
jgi:hypothetical protein